MNRLNSWTDSDNQLWSSLWSFRLLDPSCFNHVSSAEAVLIVYCRVNRTQSVIILFNPQVNTGENTKVSHSSYSRGIMIPRLTTRCKNTQLFHTDMWQCQINQLLVFEKRLSSYKHPKKRLKVGQKVSVCPAKNVHMFFRVIIFHTSLSNWHIPSFLHVSFLYFPSFGSIQFMYVCRIWGKRLSLTKGHVCWKGSVGLSASVGNGGHVRPVISD